jgi:hypothetical protein
MNRLQLSLIVLCLALCLAGSSMLGQMQNPEVVDRPRLMDAVAPQDTLRSEIKKTMSNLTELPLHVHGTVMAEPRGKGKQAEASYLADFSGMSRATHNGMHKSEATIKLSKDHLSDEAKEAQSLSYKAHIAVLLAASVFKVSDPTGIGTESSSLITASYAVPGTDKANRFYIETGVFGTQPTLHSANKWHGTIYIDAATQKVKGFRFELDGLPIMAEKMNIWKALVKSYVIEAQFAEAAVPGNNGPLTILSEITLTVKADDGITTVHNQYSVSDLAAKNSEQNQGRSQE